MKSYGLSCLLLLLLTVQWDKASGQCSLVKTTAAKCHYLEDARYIDTYNLHVLQAPSMSYTLTPGNFRNFTSLRHLDLSGGNIERIESGSFAKLNLLQSLNLAENHISHLDAGAFDGLKNLHSLHLSKNKIKQLPAALMNLKELRFLDVSDNPLNCNCASLKLRDALLVRGVKISKKTHCSAPVFARHASILKPDTKVICIFEREDKEMQGDQPVLDYEGSGEPDEEEVLDEETEKELVEDVKAEEKVVEEEKPEEKKEEHTAANEIEEETTASPAVTEESSSTASPFVDVLSTEVTSTTAAARDDITFDDSEDSKKDVTTESSVQGVTDDLIYAVTISKEPEVTNESVGTESTSKSGISDDLIIQAPASEGSGEGNDDGSGTEGSGLSAKMAAIDFNEGVEETEDEASSTTSATTTTAGSSWWGFGDIISNLNPFSSTETTEAPHTTEKIAEVNLEEEQFIAVKDNDKPVETAPDVPKVSDENTTKKSPRIHKLPEDSDSNNVENDGDPAMSQESKKGMGSYVVLGILLTILAVLVGIAAYKGDFCRNQSKRRDVERGTELKDMRKSLLDQNSAPPKIQATNGSTMENVPLMNSPTVPDEPKPNQRRYDITPIVVTNGANKSNGSTIEVNDPIKPPRKSTYPEIEAPLNGLDPPMDDIDGPTRNSLLNGSDEILSNGTCDRPPLSPGAQRVKITLQENPDSVPKTPILITRLKGGENLVKQP